MPAFHFIFGQVLRCFEIFSTLSHLELSEGFMCILLFLRHPDIVKQFFYFWLNRFWDFI
ncbi:hypothetical protein BTN49_2079 [Candidatus Enterovibrio escicola]|uniref:Uncharacterized protein n=1 Tax=Candidatus Enterovibrio escicola TaxID=1927127 RepID=A0A2A5T2J5_9GAMM|nr:hypothetical protein BTN49_2079 [Candidatus Enterovibrio escacola]